MLITLRNQIVFVEFQLYWPRQLIFLLQVRPPTQNNSTWRTTFQGEAYASY